MTADEPGGSPGPEWHWDGSQWLWWSGSEWLAAGVGDAQMPELPALPAPVATSEVVTAPPDGPYAAAAPSRRGIGGGVIAAIALGALLVLVLILGAVGFFFLRASGDDGDVVTLRTEPLSTALAEFTPPMGTDTPVAQPPAVTGVQTAPAQTPGRYGGTLDTASCDKAQLVEYLGANPDKAAAWVAPLGIATAQIPEFVAPLTPVLLRSDTAVTNHGYDNGQVTVVPAVLEAGTAVLIDEFGAPVVKCYCGNPLTPAPVLGERVRYVGDTWERFTPGAMTVVQASPTVLTEFVLVDVVTNVTFVRPAASDGTKDAVSEETQGVPQSPTSAATTPPPPAPAPTTATPAPPAGAEAGREQQAIAAMWARFRQCALTGSGGFVDSDVEEVIAGAAVTATPTGPPGVYRVAVSDESAAGEFVVNLDAGTVVPGDPITADISGTCPGVYD